MFKVVMIYGPPASGKLTTAKALQEITGFKILHNHLVVNLCSAIFDPLVPGRLELNLGIRSLVLTLAAKHGVNGIISTFTYYANRNTAKTDLAYYANLSNLVAQAQGQAYFVRLCCDVQELEKRVTSSSRLDSGKIVDVQRLRKVLSEENPCVEIPEEVVRSLSIDNTSLGPLETAQLIKSVYNL